MYKKNCPKSGSSIELPQDYVVPTLSGSREHWSPLTIYCLPKIKFCTMKCIVRFKSAIIHKNEILKNGR